jgi:hypothetical protein
MDENTFSQSLWNTANLITGFAVVQTATFTYACANKEFSTMINTFEFKISFSLIMILITAMLSYAVWWCSKKQTALIQIQNKDNNSKNTGLKTITIIRQAAYGRIILISLLLIPVLLALYAKQIGGLPYRGGNMPDVKIQKITYSFTDSSVPPEYHRSYGITITADKIIVVVDSYGEILAEKRYEIANNQFDDIVNSLKRNKIKNCTSGYDKGCSGGTIERISFSDEKSEIFSGSVYHCGGRDTGNLCGDITNFTDDIKNLVPDLKSLLL